VILHPLTRKQAVSVKKMQELQPKLKEIEEKYKNKDPEEKQKKIMEVYKKEEVNPLAGCLPVLVQMPILIALYRALLTFEPINQAHYNFIWIKDLAYPDPMYIFPVLAVGSTFLLSKMTMPASGGAEGMQKTMMYMMPFFIGWISLKFPAGLVLYWIFYNLAGAAEQALVNKQIRQPAAAVAKAKPGKGGKKRAVYRKNR
ncbi:MAG TPA: YidC/Oxa1 family membrane protein insertase, partial [Clostridia bacterium]|nr:YidC/Oxa1 family membrane protein insertase [Clostridia bacterium]